MYIFAPPSHLKKSNNLKEIIGHFIVIFALRTVYKKYHRIINFEIYMRKKIGKICMTLPKNVLYLIISQTKINN